MALSRYTALLSVALSLCISAVVAFAREVSDAVHILIAFVASPFKPAFAFACGPTLALHDPGCALPRSLQNDMRHEANVSRRSAARHI